MARFIPPHIRTKEKEKASREEQIEQARRQLDSLAEAWDAECAHLENQLYTPQGIRAYANYPPHGMDLSEYINQYLSLWTDNYLRLGCVLVENGVGDCFDERRTANEMNSIEECARHFVADVSWHAIQGDRESVAGALKEAYEFGGDFYSEVRNALTDAKSHSAWVLRDRLAAEIGIPSLSLAPPLVMPSEPTPPRRGRPDKPPDKNQDSVVSGSSRTTTGNEDNRKAPPDNDLCRQGHFSGGSHATSAVYTHPPRTSKPTPASVSKNISASTTTDPSAEPIPCGPYSSTPPAASSPWPPPVPLSATLPPIPPHTTHCSPP